MHPSGLSYVSVIEAREAAASSRTRFVHPRTVHVEIPLLRAGLGGQPARWESTPFY